MQPDNQDHKMRLAKPTESYRMDKCVDQLNQVLDLELCVIQGYPLLNILPVLYFVGLEHLLDRENQVPGLAESVALERLSRYLNPSDLGHL